MKTYGTYPQRVIILDQTKTSKPEYRKEPAPGNWPVKPVSFETYKKTQKEKDDLKLAKILWRGVMRQIHPGWVKRKTFGKFNQKSEAFAQG